MMSRMWGSFHRLYRKFPGLVLCKCGQVIDDTIIDNGIEKRNFDDDEETARCSIVHNHLLPHCSSGTLKKIHIRADK